MRESRESKALSLAKGVTFKVAESKGLIVQQVLWFKAVSCRGERTLTLAIRQAISGDCEEVARIYVVSWNAGFGHLIGHREVDSELIGRWKHDLASHSPNRWWVAELDGTIVGFAGIGPSRDSVDPSLGELDTIAVDPACWRRGVGRTLMAKCLRSLSKDGYLEAVVWTPADYPRGAGFYHATGWRPNGRVRDDGRQVSYTHRLTAG